MQELIVSKNEEGYKLRKLCLNYLNNAPASFIYKMLRKKNIVLNDHKATGDEVLKQGDSIKFYMKDETIENFRTSYADSDSKSDNYSSSKSFKTLDVIYEDDDFIFVYKPVGILSQKAQKEDYSMNEIILDYLLDKGDITHESLRVFKPSICNRLDRNTSGIILASKTPKGAQYLTRVIRERSLKKYYLAVVIGKCDLSGTFDAYLTKDEITNKVQISDIKNKNTDKIRTEINPVAYNDKQDISLLKIELITGKSHQIRSHLAYLGFPIIGDGKYGVSSVNISFFRKYNIRSQMLIAYNVIFPKDDETVLSGKSFAIKPDKLFIQFFSDLDDI